MLQLPGILFFPEQSWQPLNTGEIQLAANMAQDLVLYVVKCPRLATSQDSKENWGQAEPAAATWSGQGPRIFKN